MARIWECPDQIVREINNAGGNHQRHGGDNVLGGNGNAFPLLHYTQPHFNPAV